MYTKKWGSSSLPPFRPEQTRPRKKQMRELVKKYKVGGLLFSEGTPEEQAILTNMARKDAKIPVMVTFEWRVGTVNEAERRSGLSP